MVILTTDPASKMTHFLPLAENIFFETHDIVIFVIIWPVKFLTNCNTKILSYFIYKLL